MDNVVCKVCGKVHASFEALHRHLKAHKMTMKEYYHMHFPRYDLFDGNIIQFKSCGQYFNASFNSRQNLASWLHTVGREDILNYVSRYLLHRKDKKNLIFTPCQVELRTLLVPGMMYLNGICGNYYSWAAKNGFKNRFRLMSWQDEGDKFKSRHKIIVDTREKLPLSFSIKTDNDALPFGDYCLNDNVFTDKCYIERKGLSDLYGTMTSGYERFGRELEKAKEDGAYLVVIVEGSFQDVERHPKSRQVGGCIDISPEFVFHQVRTLIQRYDHIQFLFVNDREHASAAIERIFLSRGQYKNVDLQYLYDTNSLCGTNRQNT